MTFTIVNEYFYGVQNFPLFEILGGFAMYLE